MAALNGKNSVFMPLWQIPVFAVDGRDKEWNLSFSDIQVKELDKRASGQAFEVILSSPGPEVKRDSLLSPTKKKDLSLEEIQRKLEAAEERRKVHSFIFFTSHKY